MDQFQTAQIRCPKCSESKFWRTKDLRLKCKDCRHVFKFKPNPLNLPGHILDEIIAEFLLDHSTNIILERIGISKYKLLKSLTLMRASMAKDIPDVIQKMIKTDNYLDKDIKELENSSNNIKHPIIGVLCKEGWVFAKILPDVQITDFKFFLKTRKGRESINYHEDWQKHMGLVFKNSLYRLFPSEGKRRRIDSMETFWGYLKRKLTAKGGVRKEKLPLYLAEHVWKYNYRKLPLKERQRILSNLIFQHFSSQK